MNMKRTHGNYFGVGILRSIYLSVLIGFLLSTAGRAQDPPNISCPADTAVECGAGVAAGLSDADCVAAFGSLGAATDPSNTGTAFANDNCNDPVDPEITFSDAVAAGGCQQDIMITRTWTAADACGTDSCQQMISVADTTSPIITCPQDAGIDCSSSGDPAFTGSATATDNCDADPTIASTDSVASGACPQEDVTTRTWTATDSCGNSTSCEQVITLFDFAAPQIACPADVTVQCTDSRGAVSTGAECMADVIDKAATFHPVNTGMAAATDSCDPYPVVTFSDSSVPGACPTIQRTFTAVDACGNDGGSCVQTVTIEDSAAPVIICPGAVAIDSGESTAPSDTGTATASDNCDDSPNVTFADSFAGAVTTRTWAATDECGNSASCNQAITTANGPGAPVITCPPDVTVPCDQPTDPTNTGSATATDDTDPNPTITSTDAVAPGACVQESVITRAWSAADPDGNLGLCFQVITVVDTEAPVITCPADITIESNSGTDPGSTGQGTATDNCDPAPMMTFSDAGAGVITRIWTATDGCGNSASCNQAISDQGTPVITCPPDATIGCDQNSRPFYVNGFATAVDDNDNNPLISDSDSVTPGACPQGGVITRTWTATDVDGKSSACVQLITVTDQPPTVTCPADMTVQCTGAIPAGSECMADVIDKAFTFDPESTGFPTPSDDCDPSPAVFFSDSSAAGTCRQIERTWTVTDDCGQSSTCVQMITIEDTVAPVITCPADITLQVGDSTAPSNTGSASATDNCDSSLDVTFADSGGNPFTRTWTATDDCSNSDSCGQAITIEGAGAAPAITCPADVTIQSGDPTDPSNTGEATATDDTDPTPAITFTDNVASGTCPEESIITRTFTATDADGNSSPSCDQMITVVDTEAPVITCPADQTIESDASSDPGSTGTATAIGGVVTYTDSVSSEVVCPDVFSITRTWEATDQCGNVSSCEQKITGVDNGAPIVITGIVEGGLPQRSMLRSLAFQFSEDVSASLEAGDLVLQNLTTAQTIDPNVMTVTYDSVTNTATWTFNFPGPFFESLPDGNYCATLPAAAVEGLGCNNASSDGVLVFHRVFGDRDGDTDVDFLDSIRFRTCFFGAPNCDFRFDVDSDTDIDFLDLINFGARFNSQLPPEDCP
jgi:hypothetical protein